MLDQQIKEQLRNWQAIIKPYQKSDPKKAVVQILNSFLPFIGVLVLMYFSLGWSYWITLGLAVVNGFFLVRIFIIQHDCGHQSFLNSSRWNNAIGFVCSFFSTIPYNYWARVHNFHHGHSGQLEQREIGDVPYLTVEEYRALSWWKQLSYRFFRSPIILFILSPAIYIAISNRLPLIRLKGWSPVYRSQLINNISLLLVYALLGSLLGWKNFLLVHIPIVFIFGIIAFWFFYVQHQHEETYKQWKDNWDFLLASIRGSTYYKLPRMFQWLTGHIGFHHIHHLSSRIPNYYLEKCARENPILQKYVTTVTFGESLKCIFNKLWDESQQRMISFREYYRRERELGMA